MKQDILQQVLQHRRVTMAALAKQVRGMLGNARLALAELQLETQGTRRASKTHSLGSVLFCLAYGCQFQ